MARLRHVLISGIAGALARAALLQQLPLHPGDEFSRAKLVETARVLAQQPGFDAAKTGINPRPVPQPDAPTDLVDIELALVPKG